VVLKVLLGRLDKIFNKKFFKNVKKVKIKTNNKTVKNVRKRGINK